MAGPTFGGRPAQAQAQPTFGGRPQFGGRPAQAQPPAAPVERFTPSAGMLEEPVGREMRPTGKMERLDDDWRALIEAQNRQALLEQLGVEEGAGEAFREGLLFNIDRPIEGVISALSGRGYQHGKAVDAYMDDIRDQNLGGWGTAAEVAGSVLSPSPAGKGGFLKRVLIEALSGGGQAALEGQNLGVEGDQRNIGDIAKDFGIGGAISGALTGLGTLVRPGEIIDSAKTQQGVNDAITRSMTDQGVPRVETAGNNLRDALVREQSALKTEGKRQMRTAVRGDFAVTDPNGTGLGYEVRNIYQGLGDAPIPVTPEGTPATHAFLTKVDEVIGGGNELTLRQIDQLRVQSRGLASKTANATDKAALDNLNRSLDRLVDQKVAAGEFSGDLANNEMYRRGREEYNKALQIADIPRIRQLLKDDTIPGAAIADSLLSINTSSKSKAPAKLARVITDTLGEGSESLTAVRSGVLATMFEGASSDPAAQAKLLRTLERNETLIGDLFTPDQVSELASIRADLTNAAGAAEGSAARAAAEKRFTKFLNGALSQAGSVFKSPVRSGGAAALATGSTAAGISTAAIIAGLKGIASRPSRFAIAEISEQGAKAAGRQGAQSETIDTAIPNPRDALINQLGAQ